MRSTWRLESRVTASAGVTCQVDEARPILTTTPEIVLRCQSPSRRFRTGPNKIYDLTQTANRGVRSSNLFGRASTPCKSAVHAAVVPSLIPGRSTGVPDARQRCWAATWSEFCRTRLRAGRKQASRRRRGETARRPAHRPGNRLEASLGDRRGQQ